MIKQLYPQIKNKRTNEFLITYLMLNTNAYQWKWILTCYIIYIYIYIYVSVRDLYQKQFDHWYLFLPAWVWHLIFIRCQLKTDPSVLRKNFSYVNVSAIGTPTFQLVNSKREQEKENKGLHFTVDCYWLFLLEDLVKVLSNCTCMMKLLIHQVDHFSLVFFLISGIA